MRRARTPFPVIVLALVFVLAAAACGSSDDDGGTDASTTSSTSAPSTSTSAPDTTSTVSGGDEAAVQVYFARDEAVATAGRSVPTPAVAGAALQALFDGPDDLETGIGMGTEIPDDSRMLSLAIDRGTAIVDLTGDFESGGGSLSMQLRVAQVVFTLTQFDTVDEVDIHLDGEAVDGIGGEGVPADDLTRADFADVTPFILVESPVPGASVTSPVAVSGIANTFEANVRYEVRDQSGAVLDEGFTTATAGNGTWGDFTVSATYPSGATGPGTVVVFEDDAETGAPRNVYEVPVTLG